MTIEFDYSLLTSILPFQAIQFKIKEQHLTHHLQLGPTNMGGHFTSEIPIYNVMGTGV